MTNLPALSPDEIAQRGLAGALKTHEEGAPTQRAEFREFARKIIFDKDYQKKLLSDFRARKVSPAVERLMFEAAFCSVKVDEQGGADEARKSAEMREAVEALIRSGKSVELDHQVMGARRVLRLRPHVPQESADGNDSA